MSSINRVHSTPPITIALPKFNTWHGIFYNLVHESVLSPLFVEQLMTHYCTHLLNWLHLKSEERKWARDGTKKLLHYKLSNELEFHLNASLEEKPGELKKPSMLFAHPRCFKEILINGFYCFNDFKIRFKGLINAIGLLPNIMITKLTFFDYKNSL